MAEFRRAGYVVSKTNSDISTSTMITPLTPESSPPTISEQTPSPPTSVPTPPLSSSVSTPGPTPQTQEEQLDAVCAHSLQLVSNNSGGLLRSLRDNKYAPPLPPPPNTFFFFSILRKLPSQSTNQPILSLVSPLPPTKKTLSFPVLLPYPLYANYQVNHNHLYSFYAEMSLSNIYYLFINLSFSNGKFSLDIDITKPLTPQLVEQLRSINLNNPSFSSRYENEVLKVNNAIVYQKVDPSIFATCAPRKPSPPKSSSSLYASSPSLSSSYAPSSSAPSAPSSYQNSTSHMTLHNNNLYNNNNTFTTPSYTTSNSTQNSMRNNNIPTHANLQNNQNNTLQNNNLHSNLHTTNLQNANLQSNNLQNNNLQNANLQNTTLQSNIQNNNNVQNTNYPNTPQYYPTYPPPSSVPSSTTSPFHLPQSFHQPSHPLYHTTLQFSSHPTPSSTSSHPSSSPSQPLPSPSTLYNDSSSSGSLSPYSPSSLVQSIAVNGNYPSSPYYNPINGNIETNQDVMTLIDQFLLSSAPIEYTSLVSPQPQDSEMVETHAQY